MATTAQRIKEAMEIRGYKQADLVEKTGISKGALSSYLSGRYSPKQTNTYLIAKALNVNEAWLMGADVPLERDNYEDPTIQRMDAELEEIKTTLEKFGYKIFFTDPYSEIWVITDKNENIAACLYESELLKNFEAIPKDNTATPEKIIINRESLILPSEYELIKKYRSLDPFGQETVTIAVGRESDRTEQIAALKNPSGTIIDFPNPTPPNERLVEYFHSASAGTGVFILGNETSDTIPIPDIPENKNVDFAIKVSGESMEPDYYDGDIVLVSQKAELAHGDVGIFIVNSNAYIKVYGKTELISRNPDADNISISEYDNIVCMGKVIGKI